MRRPRRPLTALDTDVSVPVDAAALAALAPRSDGRARRCGSSTSCGGRCGAAHRQTLPSPGIWRLACILSLVSFPLLATLRAAPHAGWLLGVPYSVPLWLHGAECADYLGDTAGDGSSAPFFELALRPGVRLGLDAVSSCAHAARFERRLHLATLPLLMSFVSARHLTATSAGVDRAALGIPLAPAAVLRAWCGLPCHDAAAPRGLELRDSAARLLRCISAYSVASIWQAPETPVAQMSSLAGELRAELAAAFGLHADSLDVLAAALASAGTAAEAWAVERVDVTALNCSALAAADCATSGAGSLSSVPREQQCVGWLWAEADHAVPVAGDGCGAAATHVRIRVRITGRPICGAAHVRYGGRAGNALLETAAAALFGWSMSAHAATTTPAGASAGPFPGTVFAVLPEHRLAGLGAHAALWSALCPHARLSPTGAALRVLNAQAELPSVQCVSAEAASPAAASIHLPAAWFGPLQSLYLNEHYPRGAAAVVHTRAALGLDTPGAPLRRSLFLKWYFERSDVVEASMRLGWRALDDLSAPPAFTALGAVAAQLHPFLPARVCAAAAAQLLREREQAIAASPHADYAEASILDTCLEHLQALMHGSAANASAMGAAVDVQASSSWGPLLLALHLHAHEVALPVPTVAILLQSSAPLNSTITATHFALDEKLRLRSTSLDSEMQSVIAAEPSSLPPPQSDLVAAVFEHLVGAPPPPQLRARIAVLLADCTLTAHVRVGDVALQAMRADALRHMASAVAVGGKAALSTLRVQAAPALPVFSSLLHHYNASSSTQSTASARTFHPGTPTALLTCSATGAAPAAASESISLPVVRFTGDLTLSSLLSPSSWHLQKCVLYGTALAQAAADWAARFDSDSPQAAWATAPHPQYLIDLQEVQCAAHDHHALPLSFYLRLLLSNASLVDLQLDAPQAAAAELHRQSTVQRMYERRGDDLQLVLRAAMAASRSVSTGLAAPSNASTPAACRQLLQRLSSVGSSAASSSAIFHCSLLLLFPDFSPARPWLHVRIVTEPSGVSHPIVVALAAASGAAVQSASLAEDWAALLTARQLLLAPSTLSLLASPAGAGRARAWHYPHHGFFSLAPLSPAKHQCLLPSGAAGEGLVVHDVLRMQELAAEWRRCAGAAACGSATAVRWTGASRQHPGVIVASSLGRTSNTRHAASPQSPRCDRLASAVDPLAALFLDVEQALDIHRIGCPHPRPLSLQAEAAHSSALPRPTLAEGHTARSAVAAHTLTCLDELEHWGT